jgi:hypothetical protein
MLLDQGSSARQGRAVSEQPGAVKVDVGQEERHRPALGDLLGFGEVGFGAGWVAL